MKKFLLAGAAAFGLMAMAGAAQAGLSITGGVAASIPGSAGVEPGTPGTNQALDPLFGLPATGPLAGIFGGTIESTAGILTFRNHGAEIGGGTTNTFIYTGTGGGSHTAVGAVNAFSVPGTGAFSRTVGLGVVSFDFTTNLGGGQTVSNGSQGTEVAGAPLLNFFAHQVGNTIYLFLDDTGGQRRGGGSPPDDDNHDDLVISITFSEIQVPEPATLALFGAGLLGLGAVARRRRRA